MLLERFNLLSGFNISTILELGSVSWRKLHQNSSMITKGFRFEKSDFSKERGYYQDNYQQTQLSYTAWCFMLF